MRLVMRTGAVVVATVILLAIPHAGTAWDTDDSAQWRSLYIAGTLNSEPPNEHTFLALLASRALGLEPWLGNTGTAAIQVVDLNASIFRPTVRAEERMGDNSATPLEERRIPTPIHFAGLPDYSYTLYDWINKNTVCPVLPARAPMRERCHSFTGWMGAFNANHFGSQAAAMYQRYHAIALGLARRSAQVRQAVLASGLAEELALHDTALREMEIEALAFEHVGQHFLQDRWSMGHMWERWNAADYSAMDKPFGTNFLVGAVSGLLHGSESVFRPFTLAGDTVVGANPRLQGLAQDPLSSPARLPNPANPAAIRPARWTNAGGNIGPFDGVGDWRLSDMLSGSFGGFPLNVTSQQTSMIDCLAAGLAETISALGLAADGQGYGQHRFPLPERVPPLGEHCWDAWATDDAMEDALFSQDWIVSATSEGFDSIRISTLVNIAPQLFGTLSTDVQAEELYRLYRQHLANAAARIRIQKIRNARSPAPQLSTALSRGAIGAFHLGRVSAQPGSAYGIASWVEPINLDALPELDRQSGRDRRAVYGFFSRSHLDHWTQVADSVFPTLRGSRDPVTQAACVFLANQMYRGTPSDYAGAQRELRTHDGSSSGTPLRPLAIVFGLDETTDRDELPIDIAPGYVGGSERGNQRPFAVQGAAPQTVHNWCAAPPVLHLEREETGGLSADDIVAQGMPGSEIVLRGLRFGRSRGQVELVGRQADPQRPRISAWTDTAISITPAEGEFQPGDYRVRIRTDDDGVSVGRFVLRLTEQATADRLARWDAAGNAAAAADVCAIRRDDVIDRSVDEASYNADVQQKERELGWRREWLGRADARVAAAHDSLAGLARMRADLQRRIDASGTALSGFSDEFRRRERRLANAIDRMNRSIAYLESRIGTDPNAITRRDELARDLAEAERELTRRRAAFLEGEGAEEAVAREALQRSAQANREQLEELRWDIERAKMELTFALEQKRRIEDDISIRQADLEAFRNRAPELLRRLPPPWLTSVDAGRYRAMWVTEEAELERHDRAIAIVDALIADQHHLIRGLEFDIRAAEQALLDSDQRWQYLWRKYGGRVQWEAWATIGLELADSYENIFGGNSPASALRKNPLAVAGAAVVEAGFRIADARWGEPPSFDDPTLAQDMIEERQRAAGNPAAEAAVMYGIRPDAQLWIDGANGATGTQLDARGYPTFTSRVAGELSKPREHLKSQLQSLIEVWSESPIREQIRRGTYWSRMVSEARGVADAVADDDALRQAALIFYASAGQQRELAGAGLRSMFSAQTVKSELRRIAGGGLTSVGKDVVKTTLKEGLKELVQIGKLDAYLDAFSEELAYYAFRREYHFRSAQRQRELLDLELLREIRADLEGMRDRVLPGRLLRVEENQIFPRGSHSLRLTFSEPVAEVSVTVQHASVDSITISEDGLSAQAPFTFTFSESALPSHAVISVAATAPRTRKTLDGDPHSIACFHGSQGWLRYELIADETHRLRLALPTGGLSVVLLIDASGSMNQSLPSGTQRLEAAKAAVRRWLESRTLPEGSEIAVWAIVGGSPARIVDFTRNPQEALTAIDGLAPTGGTPLSRAIDAAGLYLMTSALNTQKALIIFSDGEDSEGADYTQAIDRLRQRAIVVERDGR